MAVAQPGHQVKDHAAGVAETACDEPGHPDPVDYLHERTDRDANHPAHHDVERRSETIKTRQENRFEDHAAERHAPDRGEE